MQHIWMYWENRGGRMPRYIDLCIQTVRRHRGELEVKLLNQHTVQEYLPGLRPEWHRLPRAAHKADYIRTRLVHKYGGMWLDCDIVALQDIQPLLAIPEEHDYGCQIIGTSIGCFVARPGCRLLAKVIEAQDQALDSAWSGANWNGIGNELLGRFGQDYPHHQWPKWSLDEIADGKVSKLLSKQEELEANVDANAVLFHLCNEALGPLIKRYVRDRQLLRSDMLVSKLFRKGLGLEAPSDRPGRLWGWGTVHSIASRVQRRLRPILRAERWRS